MPPLMQEDIETSLSSLGDDGIPQDKVSATPLHESCTTTRIPEKRVSFGPFVAVQEILSRTDFTTEELEDTWYDVEEINCLRGIARAEAKLLESGHLVETKEVSIRGLEQRTKKGSKKKKRLRMNSFAAVLLEMDFQRAECIFDDEAISEAYFKYSMPSAMAAQRVGRRDEIEARKSWRSPTHSHQKEKMRGKRDSNRKVAAQPKHSGLSRRSIRQIQVV